MANSDLTLTIDKISAANQSALEKVLTQFRGACHSDEEFSQRMSVSHGQSFVDQYWFDKSPAFYTTCEFGHSKITMSFHPGKAPDFQPVCDFDD